MVVIAVNWIIVLNPSVKPWFLCSKCYKSKGEDQSGGEPRAVFIPRCKPRVSPLSTDCWTGEFRLVQQHPTALPATRWRLLMAVRRAVMVDRVLCCAAFLTAVRLASINGRNRSLLSRNHSGWYWVFLQNAFKAELSTVLRKSPPASSAATASRVQL